jgi:hypothetical protein
VRRPSQISFTPGPAPGDRGAAQQAKAAAQTAMPGATVREVDRDTEDTAGSTYEVELNRPNGASVEVDLDAGVKVLATDRDDNRRNDSGDDD